jgi:hypothetical protein
MSSYEVPPQVGIAPQSQPKSTGVLRSLGQWFASAVRRTEIWLTSNFRFSRFGARVRPKRYFFAFNERLVLDAKALERDLKPFDRGVEDGANGYPPAEAQEFDKFHRDLLIHAESIVRKQVAYRFDILQRIGADLNATHIDHPKEKLDQIFYRTVRVDIKRLFDEYKQTLLQQRIDIGSAARHYALFKTQNCRIEEPRVLNLSRLFLAATVLVIIVAIEVVANATLLADTTVAGPAGGFAIAGLISIINVIPACVAGATLGSCALARRRRKNGNGSTRAAKAYLAIVGVAAFFVLMAIINALFAHSRLLLLNTNSLSTVDNSAVSSFIKSPIDWAYELKSLAMFCVGICTVFVSYYEGLYGFGDPYPGYSKKRKLLDTARNNFNRTREVADEDISEVFDNAKDEMESLLKENDERLQFFTEQLRQFQKLATVHMQEMIRADNIVNSVAKTYREANEAHRGGKQIPSYFGTPLTLSKDFGFDAKAPLELYGRLSRQQAQLRDQVIQYLEQITEQERIERLRLQKLIHEIEGTARDKLNAAAPVMSDPQAQTYDF